MAVTIDDDVFIDMLWTRVDEFCPDSYSHEFWEAAFNYLKDVGWNPHHLTLLTISMLMAK